MKWAIEQKTGSPSRKVVLWSIANYANQHWAAWPGLALIAEESEQSIHSVQRAISDLANLGLVRVIRLKRGGRKAENLFLLRCSPHFGAEVGEIEWLMPAQYVCETPTTCQIGTSDDMPNDVPNDMPNRHVVHIIEPYEPIEPGGGTFCASAEISKEAMAVTSEIEAICKVDPAKDEAWFVVGPGRIIQGWMDAGYTREQLVSGVRRGMMGRNEAPRTINYFRPIWPRVRAEMELPIPPPSQEKQRPNGRRGSPQLGGSPRTFTDSPDLPWNREKAAKPRERVELSAEQRELRAALAQR